MPDPVLLHVSSDLMLGGAVKSAAEAAGFVHVRALSWTAAQAKRDIATPTLILVDLELDGFSPPSPESVQPHLIAGYFAHVRTGLANAARAAGWTNIFTRGQIHGQGVGQLVALRPLVMASLPEAT